MTKQAIRLIISDIDGTILDNQHQVDPELKDIIPPVSYTHLIASSMVNGFTAVLVKTSLNN